MSFEGETSSSLRLSGDALARRGIVLSKLVQGVAAADTVEQAAETVAGLIRMMTLADFVKIDLDIDQGKVVAESRLSLDEGLLTDLGSTPVAGVAVYLPPSDPFHGLRDTPFPGTAIGSTPLLPEGTHEFSLGVRKGLLSWVSSHPEYASMTHQVLNLLAADLGFLFTAKIRDQNRLRILCHDVRNAMSIITADPSLRGASRRASDRVVALTGRHITASNKDTLSLEEMNVYQLIEGVVDDARLLAAEQGKGLRFEISTSGDGRSRVDKVLLRSAIDNLLQNALAFAPHGSAVVVRTSRENTGDGHRPHAAMPDGAFIHVVVEDQGPGVSPEILPKLFVNEVTTRQDGHGIGLKSVRDVVRAHRGFMHCETQTGEGSFTRFHLYLPASDKPPLLTLPESLRQSSQVLRGRTVIVMEDDSHQLKLLRGIFQGIGATCMTFSSSEGVLQAVQHSPDGSVAFLDRQVSGGMGGLELSRLIKGIRPDITVVICSGFVTQSQSHRDPDIDAEIAKPYHLEDLLKRVAAAVQEKRGQASPSAGDDSSQVY